MLSAYRAISAAALCITLTACPSPPQSGTQPPAAMPSAFTLTSSAFAPDGEIPRTHTCQGDDTSVDLSWSNAPAGTQSFALVVDDPDAVPVVGYAWVHWVAYNIPPAVTSLPAGLAKQATLKLAQGSSFTQGLTSWKRPGYGGPCPPAGTGVHHYHFSLFALKSTPALPAGLDRKELLNRIGGDILGEAKLTGTYIRR